MANQTYQLKGEYRWEIVDELTGEVTSHSPNKCNLILTQGLGYTATYAFAQCFTYCAIGTTNTAPLSSDTGLADEKFRTGDLDTSLVTYASSSLNGSVYSMTRVFKFSNVTPFMQYGQIGWSPIATAGNNLFSKAQIVNEQGAPAPIEVPQSKYLRVYYTLTITLSPTSTTAGTSHIVGLDNAGSASLQYVGLRSVTSSGALGYYDAGQDSNEPSGSNTIFIGQNSTAPAAFGSSVNRSGSTNYTTTTSSTYIGNGITRKRGSFAKASANDSSLRSFGVGVTGSSTSNTGFVFVFDAAQTKDNQHILTVDIYYNVTT